MIRLASIYASPAHVPTRATPPLPGPVRHATVPSVVQPATLARLTTDVSAAPSEAAFAIVAARAAMPPPAFVPSVLPRFADPLPDLPSAGLRVRTPAPLPPPQHTRR